MPELTWELLHWIFTNPLNIQEITKSEISTYIIDELRESTNLTDIPYLKNEVLFQIVHVKSMILTSMLTNSLLSIFLFSEVFVEGKKKFGSFFAYHGSPSGNFHSIIHNGIICALNKRSAYGFGSYLSTSVATAQHYANSNKIFLPQNSISLNILSNYDRLSAAEKSTRLKCIAIVEVVNDPSIKIVDFPDGMKYFVVSNDDLMQVRNLLVFKM